MSDEERIKSEAQSTLQDLLEEFSNVAAANIGLDDKHKSLLKGNTKDEIKSTAESLKSFKESIEKPHLDKIKSLEEEIKILKANGTPPKNGAGSSGKIISEDQLNKMDHLQQRDFFLNGGTVQ